MGKTAARCLQSWASQSSRKRILKSAKKKRELETQQSRAIEVFNVEDSDERTAQES